MAFPMQLFILSIPSVIYIIVWKARGKNWREILQNIGWQGSRARYFLWALGILGVTGALGWLAFRSIPAEVFQDARLNTSAYSDWKPDFTSFFLILLREAISVALGEEIFFRGFLGGWLVRKLGFKMGNGMQAIFFLLPHLPLLMVSIRMWPLVIVQAITGWLLGWLRYRSNSILPGWFVHSLANALGAIGAIR